MKRLILSVFMTLLTAVAVKAARAYSEPQTFVQPDGTTLTVMAFGDEHANWLTTTDGVMVVTTGDGFYVAHIGDHGELTATTLLAHAADQRSDAEQQACRAQRQSLFFNRAAKKMREARRAQVTSKSYFPHTGTPRSLVILANFQDVKFTSADPVAQFTQYFTGETQVNLGQNEQKNFTSVQKYFDRSSHGLFVPQFDVVGPIDLPHTMKYYGESEPGSQDDANFSQFCKDAIAAVDDDVDFHQYDNDGDGYAELVCIIFAGYGQSNNSSLPNTIWPKCSGQNVSTKDKVTVNYVNCSAELRLDGSTDINGIGVCVHELSHGMGLPDIYPTVETAYVNNQSMEFFDLMDYGEYANNGYAPVPYNAWEQEVMGWIKVERLTDSQTLSDLLPVVQGGKAYKFGNGANSEEWMYIENVQPRVNEGRIPGFPYGHGLLAYHVAYGKSTVTMGDNPNNTPGQPCVAVVPADGEVISGYLFGKYPDGTPKPYTQDEYLNSLRGDTFPGTTNTTTLSADMNLPNYRFYKGEAKPAFTLRNITENAPAITFDFDNGTPSAIRSVNGDDNGQWSMVGDQWTTIDGIRLNGQPTRKGIYIKGGRKVIVKN